MSPVVTIRETGVTTGGFRPPAGTAGDGEITIGRETWLPRFRRPGAVQLWEAATRKDGFGSHGQTHVRAPPRAHRDRRGPQRAVVRACPRPRGGHPARRAGHGSAEGGAAVRR